MSALLDIAVEAAVAGGRVLSGLRGGVSEVRSDAGKDLKLAADVLAEKGILEVLAAKSPFPVLSEESACANERLPGGKCWVVDPLDGTINFARGLPLCCVSVALWDGVRPELGVIHDFHRGETYRGEPGFGAWAGNGRPLRVSTTNQLERAVLATGFPSGRDYSTDSLGSFVSRVQVVKKVRLLGTAALSLAYVAEGILDAYEEEDIYLWDVAAGLALVVAAGGDYVLEPGSQPMKFMVLAAGRNLLPRLVEFRQKARRQGAWG